MDAKKYDPYKSGMELAGILEQLANSGEFSDKSSMLDHSFARWIKHHNRNFFGYLEKDYKNVQVATKKLDRLEKLIPPKFKKRPMPKLRGTAEDDAAMALIKEHTNQRLTRYVSIHKLAETIRFIAANISGKVGTSSETKISKEGKVLAALADNSERPDSQIAHAAGVARTSLYRMPKFRKAKEILKKGRDKYSQNEKEQPEKTSEAFENE